MAEEKKIFKSKVLSRKDQVSLFQKARVGDRAAEAIIFEANLGLVNFWARPYFGKGLSVKDLIQEGQIGLLKAIRRFDWTRGARFSTYSVWWIKKEMSLAILEAWANRLNVPPGAARLYREICHARDVFRSKEDREPTEKELEEITEIKKDRLRDFLDFPTREALRLAVKREEKRGEISESAVPAKGREWDPSAQLSGRETVNLAERLLGRLSSREQDVLRSLFYGQPEISAVKQAYGLSSSGVKEIAGRAIRKLQRLAKEDGGK